MHQLDIELSRYLAPDLAVMYRRSSKTFLCIFLALLFTGLGGPSLSAGIQGSCLERARQLPKLKAFLPGLVCGKKLRAQDPLFRILVHLGLIHVFVISGAHLVFLRQLMIPFLPSPLVPGILLLYTLMVGAQPPVMRAWLALFVVSLASSKKITPGLLFAAVALTSLVFDPVQSGLSMALSWTAVSVLIWAGGRKSQWLQLVLLYMTLLPLLLGLQIPHPSTILVNALISPVIFCVLLPISLVTWVIPWLELPVAMIWELFFSLLQFLTSVIPPPSTSDLKLNPLGAMAYAAGVHLLLWYFHVRKARRRCGELAD